VTATSTFLFPTIDVNNNGKALICEVGIRIAILIKFSGIMYVIKGEGNFMTCLCVHKGEAEIYGSTSLKNVWLLLEVHFNRIYSIQFACDIVYI